MSTCPRSLATLGCLLGTLLGILALGTAHAGGVRPSAPATFLDHGLMGVQLGEDWATVRHRIAPTHPTCGPLKAASLADEFCRYTAGPAAEIGGVRPQTITILQHNQRVILVSAEVALDEDDDTRADTVLEYFKKTVNGLSTSAPGQVLFAPSLHNLPPPHAGCTAPQLIALGYRRTSRRHRMLSRIDRPDWQGFLARELDVELDTLVRDPCGLWEDHYRRVYALDQLIVPPDLVLAVPASSYDPIGYVAPVLDCEVA